MRKRRLISSLAAALVAMALLAPSAGGRSDFPVAMVPASSDAQTVRVPGPTVVVEADESFGFDWGSAAIGAGVVAATMLLVCAADVATFRRRRPAV